MARRNRRPTDVKGAARGFQQVLDPKRAPPGITEGDIARSRSDPSRYGGIYEGAAPSAPKPAPKAPAAKSAAPKAAPRAPLPPRRPTQPGVQERPYDLENPAILKGGAGDYRSAAGAGMASLPGMPELPGPLSLPDFGPTATGSVGAPPMLDLANPAPGLGGVTVNQIPATSPNVPSGGVVQPPAATNTMPRPGISTPGTMPTPGAAAPPPAAAPPGLLDPRLLAQAFSGYYD